MRTETPAVRITQAQTTADYAVGRELFEEYAAQLGVDLCFQGFGSELQITGSMYGPPSGCLLLAWHESEAAGCVGVRRLSGLDCEMKRLYVRDGARGLGYGRGSTHRWALSTVPVLSQPTPHGPLHEIGSAGELNADLHSWVISIAPSVRMLEFST